MSEDKRKTPTISVPKNGGKNLFRQSSERAKYDFGKKVINYTFLMMFIHFGFMCYLSNKQISSEILTEFTHDFKWIYLTIFGLTIWKEKFIMIIKQAKEYGLKPKGFSEFLESVPKSEKLPEENGGYGDYYGGDCTENIESEEQTNG